MAQLAASAGVSESKEGGDKASPRRGSAAAGSAPAPPSAPALLARMSSTGFAEQTSFDRIETLEVG
jgi:hypothetical protein